MSLYMALGTTRAVYGSGYYIFPEQGRFSLGHSPDKVSYWSKN